MESVDGRTYLIKRFLRFALCAGLTLFTELLIKNL